KPLIVAVIIWTKDIGIVEEGSSRTVCRLIEKTCDKIGESILAITKSIRGNFNAMAFEIYILPQNLWIINNSDKANSIFCHIDLVVAPQLKLDGAITERVQVADDLVIKSIQFSIGQVKLVNTTTRIRGIKKPPAGREFYSIYAVGLGKV